MKKIHNTLLIGLTFLCCTFYTQAVNPPVYSGGNGTESNPYKLSKVEDFQDLEEFISRSVGDGAGLYYVLTNDLDFNDVQLQPIGNTFTLGSIVCFTGVFDGGGHTISNLVMEDSEKRALSLFGMVKDATIKNLTIASSSFKSPFGTAALVSAAKGNVLIENCHITSDVRCETTTLLCTSGILAMTLTDASVTIQNCSSGAYVRGAQTGSGGIVGAVTGPQTIIKNCVNYGIVEDWAGDVGGILGDVGENAGTVEVVNCLNTQRIQAGVGGSGRCAAGIIGHTHENCTSVTINNCYNLGQIYCTKMEGSLGPSPIVAMSIPQLRGENNYNASDLSGVTAGENAFFCTDMDSEDMKQADFLNKLNKGNSNSVWFMMDGFEYPVPCEVRGMNGSGGNTPNENQVTMQFASIKAPLGYTLTMLIKKYSSKVQDLIDNDKRISNRFTSLTPDIIQTIDGKFVGNADGKGKIRVDVSPVVEGSLDQFDPNNIIASSEFEVEVLPLSKYVLTMIDVPLTFGLSKTKTVLEFTTKYHYTYFTDGYFKLVPSSYVTQKEYYDFFLTDNSDFPIISTKYGEKTGEWYLTNVYCTSPQYVIGDHAPLRSLLEQIGFRYQGVSPETGSDSYYHNERNIFVYLSHVLLQGNTFYVVSFLEDPGREHTATTNVKQAKELIVVDEGNALNVELADRIDNCLVRLFDVNGAKLYEGYTRNGQLTIPFGDRGVFFVKAEGYTTVKVIR